MPKPKVTLQVDLAPTVPTIVRPGSHSGDSGQSGSDHEHGHSKSKTPTTATPNRVRRRSRPARRSTGITPTEADLDKVKEMGGVVGNAKPDPKHPPDPLLTLAVTQPLMQLQVPDAHDYQRAPKVAPRPPSPAVERIAKLAKDLECERRKCEENDCQLYRDLEELRRKDLNVRALEKTQQRLENTIKQLEGDVSKLKAIRLNNEKITEENASLIRVIGKLSKKAGRVR